MNRTSARSEAVSAGDRAYRYIRSRLGYAYPSGTQLPVATIARAVGASRQPVRDAVKRLAIEGLVEIVAQVGCTVVRPDPQDVYDLARVVATVDRIFLPLGAERATQAAFDRIPGYVDATERAMSRERDGDDPLVAVRTVASDFFDDTYFIATTPATAHVVGEMRSRLEILATLAYRDRRPAMGSDETLAIETPIARRLGESMLRLLRAFATRDSSELADDAYAHTMLVAGRLECLVPQ